MVVVKEKPWEMTWKYCRARAVRKSRKPLLTSGMRVPVTHSQSFPSPSRAGSLYQDSR